MRPTAVLCIVLLIFISATVETPFEKIINGFNRYILERPQEKVYVHFDRSHYFNGETIWLKSYLVEGPNHEASQLSGTVYVELINEAKEVVIQIKQAVRGGSAAGSIVLPDTLSAGNYVLRAYTNWMRNFSDEYFFYRIVKISNFNQTVKNTSQNAAISLQFFPEGGDMVNGLGSRVGFKAIGSNGLAREVQGKIVDDQGNFIVSFKSNILGMGAFLLTPENGKKYKAVIEGMSDPVSLPISKNEGATLSVINLPQQDKVSIRIQTASYKEDQIFLLVQSRGVVSFSPALTLTTNAVSVKLDKAELPAGISQITLLNKSGQPLCERLIYIEKPEKQLTVVLTSDKTVYQPREKITMTVETKDAKGKAVAADLSLAVTDDQQNQVDPYRETMQAYLYLSSDLRGYIESPGFYFDKENPDRHLAMDWLLMTQGWRRFTIDQALNYDAQKLSFYSEQGIDIKGKMVDKYTRKPVADGKVTYLGFGTLDIQVVNTNAAGEFELKNLVFSDSSKLILQGETKKGKKFVDLILDTARISAPVQFPFHPQQKTANPNQRNLVQSAIERKNIEMQYEFDENSVLLGEVEIKAKRENVNEPSRIYGEAPKTVKVEGDKSLENLLHPLQLLQGRVAGVQVSGSGLSWSVSIRGTGSLSSNTPLIMVDNQIVPLETLSSIPVRDIQSYDVWKGPEAAVFGSDGASGVIAFFTKRGANAPAKREGIFNYNNGGYTATREFYSPLYDVDKKVEKPDKRATLLWAPNIQTDSTGRTTLSFYNHDVVTSITGIIEGVSGAGSSGSAMYQYQIKKN